MSWNYNRVCIAASLQPNFYLLRRHAAPRYRLKIVFPVIREKPATIEKILYVFFYFFYFWIAVVLNPGFIKCLE